jgi:hypothetical protein
MDKGIRQGARHYFVEQNEARRRGAYGNDNKANMRFRKAVRFFLIENYGVTEAAASTHYNDALQLVKDATPELVAGLGRPADKNNGGRKKKDAVGTTRDALLANMLKATGKAPAADDSDDLYQEALAAVAGSIPIVDAVDQAPAQAEVAEKTYTVTKASDGTVIAEGVSLDVAEKLVAKAVTAKKAKLVFA